MKHEHTWKEAVFLAPKVYGGILDSDEELIKIKGSKVKISFEDLKSLLVKDSHYEIFQDKWYRHKDEAKITIKKEVYDLRVTDAKRELIYKTIGNQEIFIKTKPYIIDDSPP